MDVSSVAQAGIGDLNEQNAVQEKKKEVAMKFEKMFAQQLVKEMTKDSFKMADKNGVAGKANGMYRQHITDTLATEIAKQRKLGMAELVEKHYNV